MKYYVSVVKVKNVPTIKIEGEGATTNFPLNKRGGRAAGRFLFLKQQESWMCSSTVDHPKEVHPDFRHDLRELMEEGWHAAKAEVTPSTEVVQQERVEDYEIRGNKFIAIAINVNNPEDVHYFDIDPDVNNNAFIRACGWAYEPKD